MQYNHKSMHLRIPMESWCNCIYIYDSIENVFDSHVRTFCCWTYHVLFPDFPLQSVSTMTDRLIVLYKIISFIVSANTLCQIVRWFCQFHWIYRVASSEKKEVLAMNGNALESAFKLSMIYTTLKARSKCEICITTVFTGLCWTVNILNMLSVFLFYSICECHFLVENRKHYSLCPHIQITQSTVWCACHHTRARFSPIRFRYHKYFIDISINCI